MKSRAKELLDRSISAMTAAIEIYNKPTFSYRNETFAILTVNAWELLLKARWLGLNQNREKSLYQYERRRKSNGDWGEKRYIRRNRFKAPYTKGLTELGKQLININQLDETAWNNLLLMVEFRDCAVHFYNSSPVFQFQLYEISAACVRNFCLVISEWFEKEVSELELHLMPLAFIDTPLDMDGSLLNVQEREFMEFVAEISDYDADSSSLYLISVNVDLRFRRSNESDALPVRTTREPTALPVYLTEEQILDRYPWDFSTLTEKCRERCRDFKMNQKYHDIRKRLEDDERLAKTRFLNPNNTESSRKTSYSPNILRKFDSHYEVA